VPPLSERGGFFLHITKKIFRKSQKEYSMSDMGDDIVKTMLKGCALYALLAAAIFCLVWWLFV
jgi:hypothetical protein